MTHKLMTVPTAPFTKPVAYFCHYRRSAGPEHQNDETVLLIVNLVAGSESVSPDSCSSFLVTISRLVMELFACDRQMDGQTNITIAGPHIVAGQLIMYLSVCSNYKRDREMHRLQ